MIKTKHHVLIWIVKLEQKKKDDFEKKFFKLMNNVVFEKTKEKIREHRDIELVTTCKTRSCLV